MKAQLRTFETVSVIFVFFILLGIGIIFYGNMQKTGIEKEAQRNMELRALNAAEQAQSLPELQCSTSNVAVEKCIDQIKLEEVALLKPDYFGSFGFGEITVSQIYPEANQWTVYRNPKSGFKTKLSIQIPVLISGTEQKFGILTVSVYE